MPDLKYNIIQTPAVLPAVRKRHKELNLIEQGDWKAKYDIWGRDKDRSEMAKGIILLKEEMEHLKESIGGIEVRRSQSYLKA